MKDQISVHPRRLYKNSNNIKRRFGYLTPKDILEIKTWNLVHVDLISVYLKSTQQHNLCGAILLKDLILNLMNMIKHSTGWIKIIKYHTLILMRF